MRVVAGRQTGLTSQLRPSLSQAEEKRQYGGLMFYGLSSFFFCKLAVGEMQLPLVMLPQIVLMWETDCSPRQRWELEALVVLFFTLPHLRLLPSAYPDRPGLSSVTWRYSSDIIELKSFGRMLSFLNYIPEYR